MAPERLDEARRVGRERARKCASRLAVRRDGGLIRQPKHDSGDAVFDGGDDGLLWKKELPPWEKSYARILAKGERRLAKTMLTLWALDLFCLGVHTVGLPIRGDLSLVAASIAYPIWFGRLASQLKRRYLGVKKVGGEVVAPGRASKVLVYDRLGDFGIAMTVLVAMLEILSLETGVAFTSLIAVSGASSVVVALACQEPLGHVINGLLLTFNDKFRPGEEIMFGDVAGVVTQMGWFDTKIRLYSERTVVVPNGQIMGAPVVNFSRMRLGQYKTELRLRFEDVPRVEAAIAKLKAALEPHVITDGRNLWVHWTRIDKDALIVRVDVKLPFPGGSTDYYNQVGKLNVLIAQAVADAGAELCLPSSRRVDVKKAA